jgi:hypothetical protein
MTSADELAQALEPLLLRVHGRVVTAEDAGVDDVSVGWEGGPTVHVRLDSRSSARRRRAAPPGDLSDGLARLLAAVEKEVGGPLSDLPRAGKQRAVRLLEERGAFQMRRSVETVAEALGVTRFTVYNYLNRSTTSRSRTPA